MIVTPEAIAKAASRIGPHIVRTPVVEYPAPASASGRVLLKLENHQHTGAFKARGSLNKLMTLDEDERMAGVVTASTGNHGLGMARACQITGVEGTIYLPASTIAAKLARLRSMEAPIEMYDGSWLETERYAKKIARELRKTWISPYNDPAVVAGQGTIGLEILEQVPDVSRVLVAVGGGGLISGVAMAIKSARPDVRIIGCQPENAPEMSLSVRAGEIVELEAEKPTLSDGTLGGVEAGSITFGICRGYVDDWVLVTERQIARAMAEVYDALGMRIEGSAGVAVAGLRKVEEGGGTDVVIICGGNIDERAFEAAVSGVRS